MEPIRFNKKTILADISLLFVAVFWGSNFVIMKEALEVIEPFTYLGLRFLLAALIVAIIFWRKMLQIKVSDLWAGCLVGFFLIAGFGFQTIGLLYTTPAKSGFITGINVVIVPFLYYLVAKASPGWWSYAGGFLAAGGLFLLSSNETFGLGYGDALTMVCAFLFAAHIVSLGIYAPRRDPIILATIQLAFAGIAALTVALFTEPLQGMLTHSPVIWGAIIYAIFFCTIGAFVTQTLAQRFTPPTHAALILCLEAVFAGLFSYLFWNELFTPRMLVGALLIFTGIAVTELKPVFSARAARRRATTSSELR